MTSHSPRKIAEGSEMIEPYNGILVKLCRPRRHSLIAVSDSSYWNKNMMTTLLKQYNLKIFSDAVPNRKRFLKGKTTNPSLVTPRYVVDTCTISLQIQELSPLLATS